MSPPPLTISVVSHGQGSLARRLLNDLSKQTGFKLIVTLNVPENESFLEGLPDAPVTIVRNSVAKGFGANHNAAFVRCDTPWFAVLNPDVRLLEDPFPSLISTASGLPNPGAVAPRILNQAGRSEDSVRVHPTPWSVAGRVFDRNIGRASVAGTSRFYWLAGMFLMFSSHAFRSVRGFDERFFLYYEDYDICARLQRAGFQIALDPHATAVHDAQRDSRRSFRHLKWHMGSLLRVWTSGVFWSSVFRRG